MFGSDYFQIIHGEIIMIGELAPSGLDAVNVPEFFRGTAMDRNGVAEVCVLGQGDMVGFLSKNVSFAGPSFQQMSLADPDLPAAYGQKVSLIVVADGGEIEAEGQSATTSASYALTGGNVAGLQPSFGTSPYPGQPGLLVTSGTGAIATTTALQTDLSIKDGRWRIAQTGDYILGRLKAQLTPIVDASNIRILISLIRGGVKK